MPQTLAQTGRSRALETTLSILLAVVIAATFWGGQRYPALMKKLAMGQGMHVSGAISFDALLKVTPQMPLPKRVVRTAVNWLWTNRFGMYFALPFGAAMMTLFAQTSRPRRFASGAANVACGAVAGMPLGVCTNCATPIGQSLLMSGASTRLTVAAMISSPSFNPVVLAMAFGLFPWKLAALRVAVPALILLILPLLVPENRPKVLLVSAFEPTEPLGARLLTALRAFFLNLLRLNWRTLPWMLLAALLGALAAEAIPAYATHLPVSIFGILAVAILGTLLPVPMAFDVGLAWVLYHAGVPVSYVAALLCTLGVVSIYSLSALGQQLGRAVPLRLTAATAFLGWFAGMLMLTQP